MAIAVLDLTHGGDLIAQSLAETDAVTAVDVYGTVSDEMRRDLKSSGIPVLTEPPDAGDFDLIVAPVHLDSAYRTLHDAHAADVPVPVITHHAAVYEILKQRLKRYHVIEVTGTTAKTSTVRMLAGMLAECTGKKIISHTSAGVEYWDGRGEDRGGGSSARTIAKWSIAPASILGAVESVKSEPGMEPDIFIFEVSLGGTGLADTGIITTLTGDYLIANKTGLASSAKMQMVERAKPGSTLILNSDVDVTPNPAASIIRFGDGGSREDVHFEEIDSGHAVVTVMNRRIEFAVKDYDIFSYRIAILGAVSAAISMDIDPDCIASFLDGFHGVSGRMKILKIDGRTIVDNSNSGMNISSAESAIDHARRIVDDGRGKVVMIIGIEEYNVCEGLDTEAAVGLIGRNRDFIDRFITVGIESDCEADDRDSGMDMAMDMTEAGDTIISCVKCFR
ncbi:MAG: UDP-N-acetylmuramoylalanine--D-glutamate ligase [Candidatus Methanogaster sp.]|nr:MAG: UDP-N-acetylmuramoylalanine--D-glutamate ligase [ANME-2 cluster archaeon]